VMLMVAGSSTDSNMDLRGSRCLKSVLVCETRPCALVVVGWKLVVGSCCSSVFVCSVV